MPPASGCVGRIRTDTHNDVVAKRLEVWVLYPDHLEGLDLILTGV